MLSNCGTGENSWKSLDRKIKLVSPKAKETQIFIGRTDAEIEAPILWPPNVKYQLIRKDPDLGNTEGKMRKGGRGRDGQIALPTQ